MPWTRRFRTDDRPRLAPVLALGLAGLSACSSASTDGAGLEPDAGSHVVAPGSDAGGRPPPGPDAGPGAGHDAGADSGAHEAGSHDAGVDTGVAAGADASSDSGIPPLPGWTLTWHDEFDLPDGSPVDPASWTQETGNSGWGYNHEREYYTPGTANAVIRGGSLVITATPQGASQLQCQYGACEYTSARMNTAGKFEQQYGRFEARIQLPGGQGLWPAWWLLGNDIGSVSWPRCGEIDIMENIGSTPSTNYGSLHGPGYSGGHDITGSYSLPGGAILADDYHLFALEWDAGSVRFYVDGVNYETRTPADVPAGDTWVYDHPFFVILNVAVGGYWPGDPDSTTTFPQTMKVDYVRVYTKAP
jgi:beta-glucanase (GH16 family)